MYFDERKIGRCDCICSKAKILNQKGQRWKKRILMKKNGVSQKMGWSPL